MTRFVRSAALATVALLVATTSCNVERPIAPKQTVRAGQVSGSATNITTPPVVISQIYGGGGNANTVYKNDFIELFNPGAFPVNVTGWTVQYGSNSGTSWQATTLSGTIPAGGYYLVQEQAGAGGTTALPTPDATGIISMSATAGKVILAATGVHPGSTDCPSTSPSAFIIDFVSFGSTNCATGGTTPAPSNAAAVIRKVFGCTITGNPTNDFQTVAPPTPRNAATAVHDCGIPPVAGVVVNVVINPATASTTVGNDVVLQPRAYDAFNTEVTGFLFALGGGLSGDGVIGGVATFHAVTAGDFTVNATAPNGIRGFATIHVVGAPVVASVTVTPATASVIVGGTQQFTAKAFDASSVEIPGITFTWTSLTPAVATVDANGLATSVAIGDAQIQAKATTNNVGGAGSLHVDPVPPPPPTADLVISQVFGGGGNNGSVYTNDFIEIFNRSGATVSLAGWSVQQTSAAGTSWTVTALSGSIPAHGYYLVQEVAQGGGTAPLPTPDAVGTIAMGATSGKVILASQIAAFSGACPSAATIIDRMGYGASTSALACNTEWGGRTDDLSVTNSAARLMSGCFSTTKGAFDFQVQSAAPRNSAAAPYTCPAPSAATIVVNEILAEPFHAAGGPSWGEWFEVKNTGAAPVDLMGWTISTQGQAPHVISTSLVVPPGGHKVLGRGFDPAQNGGITLDYNYFTTSPSAIFLDARDFIMLTDGSGGLVDIARWTNSATIVLGSSLGVRDASADNIDVGGSNWGYSTTQFGDGDFGTPGADNGTLATSPLVFPNKLVITGRFSSDPALPIGFEDQLFANEVIGATGDTVRGLAMTWTALTPTFASIDATTGLMHALAPGSAQFRVTAPDGTTGTTTLPMAFAQLSTTAHYGNNTEFGDPVDNDPSDDFIIRRDQYTTSYNKNRNTPNWVSYNLEGSHIGSLVDRCDCFTMDPLLPPEFLHINTNDYTGAGGVAGYGIDRGHMARSFDRTTGELDNAYTYLLSNVIPQAADLNQGPWAVFETFLGDKARFENKEVYIIVGVAGSKGFIKNESKIVMPARVWKVAVIMPKDKGLADVHTYQDLEVIAINAPNDPGVRNTDWHDFITTVDAIEALSGYDLLSLLPDKIENAVESNTKPPIAAISGPPSLGEGNGATFFAAGSIDPNGSIVSYQWNFGDGGTGSGFAASHLYSQDGTFTVTLTVTDNDGLTDVATTTVAVTNVAPDIQPFDDGIVSPGGAYSASGTFYDSGADAWTATVDYGDGSGVQPLALSGHDFTLAHTFATGGTFTIRVRISDDDVTASRATTIIVKSKPVAATSGPYAGSEGSSVSLSGAGSTDADGSIVSYAWDFGDGSTGAGASPSHTYAQDGSYTATLTITDNDGLTNSATTTVTVSNVAPSVSAFAGASINVGGTYSASGTFSDPGSDVCTATVNYGDGSGTQLLSLSGGGFTLSHAYTAAGTYTITVSISDDDVTTTRTATVVVLTAQQQVDNVSNSINQLIADGALSGSDANSLLNSADGASKQLGKGNTTAAKAHLNTMIKDIDKLLKAGKLSPANAAALTAAVQAAIAAA